MASGVLDSFPLSNVIIIICQTFFYGIYFCLFPISIYIMVTKGLQTRSRKWLFAMTITMFALSSMFWIMSIIYTFNVIDVWRSQFNHVPRRPPDWFVVIGLVPLFNHIITDGVAPVWRAWVLCYDQKRVVLMFPVIVLAISALLFLVTAVISASEAIFFGAGRVLTGFHFNRIVTLAQVANLALSLLANTFATSIIAVKAWKYRKTLMTSGVGLRTPTRAIRILGLVVESGLLYIFISVVALISPFIDLPLEMLGRFFMPVSLQLAGMYPIVIPLLVVTNRSLDTTYFSSSSIIDVHGGQRSQMEPMNFAAGVVLAASSQTDRN